MSSSLPARLQAALPAVAQPRPGFDPFDPAFREALLEWGLEVIANEIRPDPIFRPLDYARRVAAEREWRKVVRAQGTQLRTLRAESQTAIAREAVNDIIFQIQERRRTTMQRNDARIRVQEYAEIAEIDTEHAIRRAEGVARATFRYQPTVPEPEDPMPELGATTEPVEVPLGGVPFDAQHVLTRILNAAGQLPRQAVGGDAQGCLGLAVGGTKRRTPILGHAVADVFDDHRNLLVGTRA